MQFFETRLKGAVRIEPERVPDHRGFFARTYCAEEFAAAGLATQFVQANVANNRATGTLRGLHYQRAPHQEIKLVRCSRGSIHDVILDLRPTSPTYLQWEAFRLDAASGTQLYIPAGFAHGYQTLEPDTEVTYLVSCAHEPGSEGGIRHDDPRFRLLWPLPVAALSEKDRSWADWTEDSDNG